MSQEKKSKGIDISKIELVHVYEKSAGHSIRARFNQKIEMVEATFEKDCLPVSITYVPEDSPEYLFSERWVQFKTDDWCKMIDEIFEKLVTLWNEKQKHNL